MKLVRAGICCLLAFAVVSFGAVEEWSQAVLQIGAATLLILWTVRTYQFKSEQVAIPEEVLPLVVLTLVVAVQWIFRLTAVRYYTRVELQLLVTYVIVVFLMAQAFSRRSHWRNFMWFLMTLGFVISIFGILQHLTFNGKLYWFRVLRFGGIPFGPYVNRNHFAGFAEMIIPVALVPLVLGKVRRERMFLVGILAVVPIVALFLSASRGGIVSFLVQMMVLFGLLLIRRVRGRAVLVGGFVLLCGILLVSWLGVQQVLERFTTKQNLEVSLAKRAAMRRDTFQIFLDHPIVGTGLGTLEAIYPPYDTLYDGKVVNHTHNDYLEALAETGILGGLCWLWFLGVVFRESLKGLQDLGASFGSVLNLTGLTACTGILVHSLVDFNLHIPANALLFFVSAHMAVVRLEPIDQGAEDNGGLRRRRKRKQ